MRTATKGKLKGTELRAVQNDAVEFVEHSKKRFICVRGPTGVGKTCLGFESMREPFYYVGPTGAGKSAIAVALAERCGWEIINADAYQLYEGLDIVTAKPSAADFARVPHHLFGATWGIGLPLAALLFGLCHLVDGDLTRLRVVFFGFFAGWLRARTETIAVPAAYHGVSNLLYDFMQRSLQ